MINDTVIECLTSLFKSQKAKNQFKKINDSNTYEKAKKQAEFIVNNSNSLFSLVNIEKSNEVNNDAAYLFGDFKDSFGNYYDLTVGTSSLAGSISEKSLKLFGIDSNHYYICTTSNFDKLYIINAHDLLSKIPAEIQYKEAKNKTTGKINRFLGEFSYQSFYKKYI